MLDRRQPVTDRLRGAHNGGTRSAPPRPNVSPSPTSTRSSGPKSSGFDNWSDATEIATALGSTTQFPDLPLSITAPGEESGTFDSFVELVIDGLAEEREVPEEERTTRPDYQSSSNDNAIIDGVANAAGSLGWVGFAFFEENLDRVRAFTIAEEAGGTCVEPTAETIASNEYPISRDLYIYVNKAKAAENPAVVAYVDYYMAGGTIDVRARDRSVRPAGARCPRGVADRLDERQGLPDRVARRHDRRSPAARRSSRSRRASPRTSRPRMPASTTRSRGPEPGTGSPSSVPVRPTSPMRREPSATRRRPPARRPASNSSS